MIIGKDFNHLSWERTSPSRRVPEILRYISLAEANGMIYVFGLSEESQFYGSMTSVRSVNS